MFVDLESVLQPLAHTENCSPPLPWETGFFLNENVYRNRNVEFVNFVKGERVLAYCSCSDVPGLKNKLGYDYSPYQWRLFIGSSKLSLKEVLLHNGNDIPSVPLVHGIHVKETYIYLCENVLEKFQYNFHSWKICAELKTGGTLPGLQGGYPTYWCFSCDWDSRARIQYYIKKIDQQLFLLTCAMGIQ